MKFNQTKYNSLLKQLEAVEIRFSELEDGIRIDAELYKKNLIHFERKIKQKKYTTLGNEALIIKKGIFDIKAETYSSEGIPFVRISNLKNMGIMMNDIIYIPEKENNKNLETFLQRNDIILSKTATAAASLVDIDYCNTSQDTVAVKLKSDSELISHYVVTFLNTEIGLSQMQRWFTGNIQMHLNLTDCKEKMLIPIFSKSFQSAIKSTLEKSITFKKDSENLYRQAEQTLLLEIDLFHWQETEKNTVVKKFSNFVSNGRLDAEYYQPKYDELFSHLNKVRNLQLHQLVNFKKSIEPGSEAYQLEGIPFIRVSDISKFGISHPEHHLDRNEFDIEELKPKKDTILLTKDGSVGIAYKVDKDLDVITSGALLHLTLKSDEVLPDYLALVLNSKLAQMQAERDAGGSIIQHWRPDEIKQVVVPILSTNKQKELVKQIKNSFKLREESSRLIETAKQAVEIAIEKDEKEAFKYLE